ncbi:MAG: hypothetical protein KJ648_07335 [Candidatus Omnitrophica bacterium]|nr:hypothetical protein [Candidatus Omnitrophota bacterium]
MSQILPDELEFADEQEAPRENPNAPAAFHGALKKRPALETSHASLTRTMWVRRTIEEALVGNTVEVFTKPNGEIALRLDTPLPRDILGYDLAPRDEYSQFELWGMSGKMQCPTWDLTAGPPSVGGSCPASTAGQSICEVQTRKTMLKSAATSAPAGADQQPVKKGQIILTEKMPRKDGAPVPVPFYEGDEDPPNQWRTPICQYCYASAGNYRGMHVAVGGIVRYHWTRYLILRDPDLWVRTVVASMKQLDYPLEGKGKDAIMPVRIHSAGDFYSPKYAEAWIKVANEMFKWDPRIVMWAPTRSWATPNWAETDKAGQTHWKRLLDPDNLLSARPGSPRLNFVVRASSYHVGDEAAGRLHPTNCVGTSSVFRDDNASYKTGGREKDPRFDIDCPVYNVERDAKTCQWAIDPVTKKMGCRACWRYLDKRVNFTTH